VSYLDRLRALEGRGSNSLPEKKGATPQPTKATEGASVGSVGTLPPTLSDAKARPPRPAAPAKLRVRGPLGPIGPSKRQASGNPLSAEAMERRRLRAVALLEANPERRLAVVCDDEGDPVPVAVAIRGKGTCEVHIPAARFGPFALLELVARHGGTVH